MEKKNGNKSRATNIRFPPLPTIATIAHNTDTLKPLPLPRNQLLKLQHAAAAAAEATTHRYVCTYLRCRYTSMYAGGGGVVSMTRRTSFTFHFFSLFCLPAASFSICHELVGSIATGTAGTNGRMRCIQPSEHRLF